MRVDKSKWRKFKIADVFRLEMGKTPSRKELSLWENGTIPWVSISDMGQSDNIKCTKEMLSLDTITKCNIPIVPVGVVIMSFKLSIGKTAIADTPLTTNEAIMAFYPKETNFIFNRFLLYLLRNLNWKGNRAVKGITINKKIISKKSILIPPYSEQQGIASELDAIQEVIDGYKAQLADLDVLAQSIFLDTFGDPVSNPKGWGKKTLNEVCSKITDGTHDTPKRLTDGIKFITGKHIRPFFIDYDHSDYVSENVHKEIYARCNPQKGDVLYTNIGSGVGTAAVNTVDYEFSMKNVALLKPSKELNGIYLQFVLNDIHFKSVVLPTYLAGGAQSFLSLKQIKSMPIPLPDFVHQQQFAEQVEAIEKQKDLLREQLKDAETLMAERMQYYFS